ncbi:MAG: GNAT family N-acetyltransferase [Bacilli bacterium]
MKIIEYDNKFDNQIKDLLVELQNHIVKIDREKFNIITYDYREQYFKKTIDEVAKYQGKIFLLSDNNSIVGLIVGLINNDEIDTYDFKCPKRGRISELVVSSNVRNKGYGKILLNAMEEYLYNQGCKNILIGVFSYNDKAINFYEKNGYHIRMTEMIK